ncbi:Phytosulfokine [Sesbania bispinosa]|nr:Phytosulfokine [Sesbania bispinosa]
MKQSFHFGALLFFFFFLVSSSARPLINEQGRNIKLDDKVSAEDFVLDLEGSESFKMLGMEDCNIGDEECLKRRMTIEAHLDYYTQHHKP